MAAVILKAVTGLKPLAYWRNQLVVARGYDIYLADLRLERLAYLGSIPLSRGKRLCLRSRWLSRLLRLDIGPARVVSGEDKILLCADRSIYAMCLQTGRVETDFVLPWRGRPLHLTEITIPGFKPGIYFGEYMTNDEKNSVNIYHRASPGAWNIVHRFDGGAINHVHNIVEDGHRDCVYILTGDFGDAAAIWRATAGFSQVERVASMGQQHRACWIEPGPVKLFFATDTQLEVNYLSALDPQQSGESGTSRLFPILGSSIYRAEREDGLLVFSTSVEPDQIGDNWLASMVSRHPGPGILSDQAAIYVGSEARGHRIVLSDRKDGLPLRLFQFGTFQFPSGTCPNPDLIHAYGVATRQFDNRLVVLDVGGIA